MSGTSRIKSASNIYHVILRGNNKNTIFFDDQDYSKFSDLLFEKVKNKQITLYAWCLMPNHIHLLIKEKQEPIGDIFASILTSFVIWYNNKYSRSGHLFERKFRSQTVEDETYFLRVFRYIHRNPLEANLCNRMDDYPYSSFSYYFRGGKYKDDDLILNLMTKDDFESYHYEKDETNDFLDVYDSHKLSDKEFISIISQFGMDDITQVKDLPQDMRTIVLQELIREGASYRQIHDLTGIQISIIRAVSKELHQRTKDA